MFALRRPNFAGNDPRQRLIICVKSCPLKPTC